MSSTLDPDDGSSPETAGFLLISDRAFVQCGRDTAQAGDFDADLFHQDPDIVGIMTERDDIAAIVDQRIDLSSVARATFRSDAAAAVTWNDVITNTPKSLPDLFGFGFDLLLQSLTILRLGAVVLRVGAKLSVGPFSQLPQLRDVDVVDCPGVANNRCRHGNVSRHCDKTQNGKE